MKRLDPPTKREAVKGPHALSDQFSTQIGQDVGTSYSTGGMPTSKRTQNPLGNASKRTKGM